jgi:hypothetical protein
MRKELLAETT